MNSSMSEHKFALYHCDDSDSITRIYYVIDNKIEHLSQLLSSV